VSPWCAVSGSDTRKAVTKQVPVRAVQVTAKDNASGFSTFIGGLRK
jgi:hypothetical protein